ncbi:hypothetical protein TIFTF001_042272 [Ficus carica]|uniref:Retrotransposon gag domain-containing protein n=1 Tax=Ficus carica TaxID=3494 RepID=A0AA87ZKQ8_FICCA|nr:hypothetical protein TIFTF001_042270 [Ficus carica]GMN35717.1 hypothetical protein TIFTF001_042272 [Ficus carica]
MSPTDLALREGRSMAKCLFSKAILKMPKPEKFTALNMKTFDGKTDLVDFLHLFRQVMMLEMSNENLLFHLQQKRKEDYGRPDECEDEINESLKTFLKRLTHELNKVEVVDKRVVANIFRDGLIRKHKLHEMLTRESPKCMADVTLKAEGSIRAEEVGYVKYSPSFLINRRVQVTNMPRDRQQEKQTEPLELGNCGRNRFMIKVDGTMNSSTIEGCV